MKNLFLALLCAAPLMAGYGAYDVSQPVPAVEPAASAEVVYLTSMGCDVVGCTDPAHCHYCVYGCTEAEHYHDCPVGCADPSHPHCGQCWETAPEAGPMFCASMGCGLADCTDPTHYHSCPAGCTDPAHYHDCPIGCSDPAHYHDCPIGCRNAAHAHGGRHHSESRGHHGWGHH